jgi:ATP-dependent RNA helicase DeaD
MQLDNKNVVSNMHSKKFKWEDIGVSPEIIKALEDLKMQKPSIIQAASILKIIKEREKDFLFQATNGCGKTLSFGIPAIMSVDPSIKAVQVIIIANTRELIRQVQDVLRVVSKNTKVTSCIGDQNTSKEYAHIIVTVPKWIENKL